ncbi:MAG: ribosome maturation factor RimP [Acidimicrobiia bacterium]|nr:ribosome maturation factor RimP [Acidimicrobiia bacterium]
MDTREAVGLVVARALTGMPEISLYDVEVKGSGRGRVISITVDKPGGTTVDDCAAVSERVSVALDSADPVPGPYRLDVASPGLERPLRNAAHFRHAVGSEVQVRRVDGVTFHGTLVDADGDGIEVHGGEGSTVDGAAVRIAYADISRARTVVDWEAEIRGGSKVQRGHEPARQGKTS